MHKTINAEIGFALCFLLTGIYIVPERTRIIAFLTAIMISVYFVTIKSFLITNQTVIVLWLLLLFIGASDAIIFGISLSETLKISLSIILGIAFGNIYFNKETRKKGLTFLLITLVIVVIGCMLQLLAPQTLSRITSVTLGEEKYLSFLDFTSYNALVGFSYQTGVTGYYLAVLEGMILCFFLAKKDKSRLLSLLLILAYIGIAVLILLTRKRAQMLAVILLSMLVYMLYNRKRWLKILLGSLTLVMVALFAFSFTSAGKYMIAKTMGPNATSSRGYIYSILLENFRKSPIIGNGFGYTLQTVDHFANGHNVFLQILSENGVIGLAIFLSIIMIYTKQAFMCFRYSLVAGREMYEVSLCFFIEGLFVLSCFTGNPLYDVFPIILYCFTTGIIRSTLLDLEGRNE